MDPSSSRKKQLNDLKKAESDVDAPGSSHQTLEAPSEPTFLPSCFTSRPEGKPYNVSTRLWEKFRSLEKRTDDETRASTLDRINRLKSDVMHKVSEELSGEEDRAALRKCNVDLTDITASKTPDDQRKRKMSTDIDTKGASKEIDSKQDFLNVKSQFQSVDLSRPKPSTALEKRVDEAIKNGDIVTAERLSDHLAERELSEKIVSTIDAQRFLDQKQMEKRLVKSKKKRKLSWGFEAKQRWETKGNM